MTIRPARLAGIAVGTFALFACIPHVEAASVPISSFSFDSSTSASDGGIRTSTITNNGTSNFLSLDTTSVSGKALQLLGGSASSSTKLENNGKYISFAFDTTGYTGLTFSYSARRSSAGFTSQALSYAVSGSSVFTDIGTVTTLSTSSFQAKSFDLSSDLENKLIDLRITFSGATDGGGVNRIDNAVLSGTASPSPVPLPPAVLAGSALLGVVGFLKRRRPATSV